MHYTLAFSALMATFMASSFAAPSPQAATQFEGLNINTCPSSTSDRKALFLSKSATVQDLAITIQETSCDMNSYDPQHYLYGDSKTNDSACFGPFKVNWYTIRTYCSQFQGQTSEEWNNGAALNNDNDPSAAIQCLHEQQNAPAVQANPGGWWELQRNGATPGSCAPDPTGSIYHNAITQITDFLNGGHTQDNLIIDPMVTAC